MAESHTYPTSGSLGAELYEMTEQDFLDRFGQPLKQEPKDLHPDLPPEAQMGFMTWALPMEKLLINPCLPPLQEGPPTFINIGFSFRAGEDYYAKLAKLGFPLPDDDPQLVTRDGNRTLTCYYSPPRDLRWLAYTGVNMGNLGGEIVIASMPCTDETERQRLVDEANELFPQCGTIYFEGKRSEIQKKLEMKGLLAIILSNAGKPDLGELIDRTVERHLGAELLLPGSRRARTLL